MGETKSMYFLVRCVDSRHTHARMVSSNLTICRRKPVLPSATLAMRSREEACEWCSCKQCARGLRRRIDETPKYYTTAQSARWAKRIRDAIVVGATVRDITLKLMGSFPTASAFHVEDKLRAYRHHWGIRLEGKGLEAVIMKEEDND